MKRVIGLLTLAAFALVLALPAVAQTTSPAPATPAPAKPAPVEQKVEKKAVKHTLIDINTATKEQLMKEPGVTEEIASKIVAQRPFKKRSELLTRGIVTRAEYEKLSAHLQVKPEKKAKEKPAEKPTP